MFSSFCLVSMVIGCFGSHGGHLVNSMGDCFICTVCVRWEGWLYFLMTMFLWFILSTSLKDQITCGTSSEGRSFCGNSSKSQKLDLSLPHAAFKAPHHIKTLMKNDRGLKRHWYNDRSWSAVWRLYNDRKRKCFLSSRLSLLPPCAATPQC